MRVLLFILPFCLLTSCVNRAAIREKARSKFDRLETKFKLLTSRRLVSSRNYVTDQKAILKLSDRSQSLAKRYEKLALADIKAKTPNKWTYAALYRSAQLYEELGRSIKDIRSYYKMRKQSIAVAGLGVLYKNARKEAFEGYIRTLFLANYYHRNEPSQTDHIRSKNDWLIRANTSRCSIGRDYGSHGYYSTMKSSLQLASRMDRIPLSGEKLETEMRHFRRNDQYTFSSCPSIFK